MARIGNEWKATSAARMLSDAIENAKIELNLSIRKIGQQLGYKQATVISHMANGREPIPIDRAEELAKILEMDPALFLLSVVQQRYPDVDWSLINRAENERLDTLGSELENILEAPLTSLNERQRDVMREVASEPQPHLRWLSVNEAAAAKELLKEGNRTLSGPSPDEIDEILSALENGEK